MTVSPRLTVRNLSVRFGTSSGPVVENLNLDVSAGECFALVGESGSGKSVTARTLIGLTGRDASVTADTLKLDDLDVSSLSTKQWQTIRGRRVGFVLQDALVSLDPLRTIGREIDDVLRLHTHLSPAQRQDRVRELLDEVGIPNPELRMTQRADELSGGMRQRALIASAIALRPDILIADEPTTALDATVQTQILDLLARLREQGTAVILISHDLSVVERVADRIAVMKSGHIVESGQCAQVLRDPTHEYTKALLHAIPSKHPRGTRLTYGASRTLPLTTPPTQGAPVLELIDVSKRFSLTHDRELRAVDNVSLAVHRGSTVGLVGESGSGKSTTARIALGITKASAGEVRLLGEKWAPLPESQRRGRRETIGAIYQDAFSSFDPRWSVERILTDSISTGQHTRVAGFRERVADLLVSVGLRPDVMTRRTASLSGGQRQRVAIARAIAPGPQIIVCDEPVSSLDVSIQAQVLDLLDEIQERLGIAYLFISHDLGVIRHVSDTIAVMTNGCIVEHGPTESVFTSPQHPYTQRLLATSISTRSQ